MLNAGFSGRAPRVMKFPYGLSDFGALIRSGYWYQDRAGDFEGLFGDLAIGRAPTPLHHRYFIMKWDFSLVKAQGGVRELEAALHRHLNDRIRQFADDYAAHWTGPSPSLRTTPSPRSSRHSVEKRWMGE